MTRARISGVRIAVFLLFGCTLVAQEPVDQAQAGVESPLAIASERRIGSGDRRDDALRVRDSENRQEKKAVAKVLSGQLVVMILCRSC